MLVAVWRDPDFDLAKPAAYYLRALEIPTPRMTTFGAHLKNTPLPQDWPSTIQERGWASPIWYTPPAADNGQKKSESFRTTRVPDR